jgi:hypothetical protein
VCDEKKRGTEEESKGKEIKGIWGCGVVGECQGRRGEIRKGKRKKGERESEWDICSIVDGWVKIMLSLLSQPCADMW